MSEATSASAERHAPADPAPNSATPQRPAAQGFWRREVLGVPAGHLLLAVSLIGAVGWGTWTTRKLLALEHKVHPIVKIQLGELVGEYVRGEARSGVPAEQIPAQTGAFMKLLNGAVDARAQGGAIIMLSNAVVDGDVPDVTQAVRQDVYAKIQRPAEGKAPDTTEQMKQFFQQGAASSASGQ